MAEGLSRVILKTQFGYQLQTIHPSENYCLIACYAYCIKLHEKHGAPLNESEILLLNSRTLQNAHVLDFNAYVFEPYTVMRKLDIVDPATVFHVAIAYEEPDGICIAKLVNGGFTHFVVVEDDKVILTL